MYVNLLSNNDVIYCLTNKNEILFLFGKECVIDIDFILKSNILKWEHYPEYSDIVKIEFRGYILSNDLSLMYNSLKQLELYIKANKEYISLCPDTNILNDVSYKLINYVFNNFNSFIVNTKSIDYPCMTINGYIFNMNSIYNLFKSYLLDS